MSAWPPTAPRHRDALGIALVARREVHDAFGQGGREEQCAALGGRRVEDYLEILAEAEVEHLVGLVEHHGPEILEAKAAALQVVAQAAGRTDHHVGTGIKRTGLAARVHAAHASHDGGARLRIQPLEFALHLQRQFARRSHHQDKRRRRGAEPFPLAEKAVMHREPERDGLSGAGLGRHQEVAARESGIEHRGLHGGGLRIATLGEGVRERRAERRERQGVGSRIGLRAEGGAGPAARCAPVGQRFM